MYTDSSRYAGYYLLQSIIVYTLGIRIALNRINSDTMSAYPSATGIAFIACLLVTAVAGEIFYWVFDKPAGKGARMFFTWLRE